MKPRKLKLIPEWRRVLKHAWSVRMLYLAAALSGLEAVVPLLPDLARNRVPTIVLAIASFLVIMGAFIARFVVQHKVRGDEDAE